METPPLAPARAVPLNMCRGSISRSCWGLRSQAQADLSRPCLARPVSGPSDENPGYGPHFAMNLDP